MRKKCAVSVWSCLIPRCFPRRASKSQTTCVKLSFKNDRGRSTELVLPPAFRISEYTCEYSRLEIHCLCISDLVSWSLLSFFVCNEFSGPQCVTGVVLILNMSWASSLLFLCANLIIQFLLTCHPPNSANTPLNCERKWCWDSVIWTREPHGAEVGFFFF